MSKKKLELKTMEMGQLIYGSEGKRERRPTQRALEGQMVEKEIVRRAENAIGGPSLLVDRNSSRLFEDLAKTGNQLPRLFVSPMSREEMAREKKRQF